MQFTLRGLPELEQFESEEAKRRAVAELEREAGNPFSSGWASGAGLIVALLIALTLALHALLHRIPVVGELSRQGQEFIRLAITLPVFFAALRLVHRWGAAEQLREKLIAAGVPVCRGCGYALKGLPRDSSKCPECGRDFDEDVMKLIRHADGALPLDISSQPDAEQREQGQ